ncbi:4-hydroxy-tetrahydrodipicolinate reductase [Clostridia bacterium]|nr:4-hydroxy-tetrahydrodipicolinate reductase [Clostridia bacterium]
MKDIRVLVCGAMGKMGQQVIQAVTLAEDMSVVAAVDTQNIGKSLIDLTGDDSVIITGDLAQAIKDTKPDVMVDFTNPKVVYQNVSTAIDLGVHPVIGATGLSKEQTEDLSNRMEEKKLGGLLASNFAIGAILMVEFSKKAAAYMQDVEIIEYHHDKKLDAPSGTSLSTAKAIAEVRKSHKQGHPEEKELLEGARGANYDGIPIHSVRLPGRVAHQEVIFGSLGQILTIRHDSINRESFMPGVLLGIREVCNKEELIVGLEKLL